MTTPLPWICSACVHHDPEENTCPAFPKGIPLEPLKEPLLHDEPLPGQVGDTVFEMRDNMQAFFIYEILSQHAERLQQETEGKEAPEETEDERF